ncbi:MAG TPA: hypothetical protein VFO38_02380 [Candidatus Saccharimonadales bacterium]|nr:hypothetical protein [Candidatus Saccharimonadales bacterium]
MSRSSDDDQNGTAKEPTAQEETAKPQAESPDEITKRLKYTPTALTKALALATEQAADLRRRNRHLARQCMAFAVCFLAMTVLLVYVMPQLGVMLPQQIIGGVVGVALSLAGASPGFTLEVFWARRSPRKHPVQFADAATKPANALWAQTAEVNALQKMLDWRQTLTLASILCFGCYLIPALRLGISLLLQ